MELLRKSCDELSQTIVVVTHDPKAASYADRIVFLRDGLIVETIYFEKDFPFTDRLKKIITKMEQIEE